MKPRRKRSDAAYLPRILLLGLPLCPISICFTSQGKIFLTLEAAHRTGLHWSVMGPRQWPVHMLTVLPALQLRSGSRRLEIHDSKWRPLGLHFVHQPCTGHI